jgi:hypothetical protein
MALTVQKIHNCDSEDSLLKLLGSELHDLFPPEIRNDAIVFLSRIQNAPVGLRAMATTYELDVSITVDDLAWHFINHHGSLELTCETIAGLNTLGAKEEADVFQAALKIIEPHWENLEEIARGKNACDWLESSGVWLQMTPLNQKMCKLANQYGPNGFMSLWASYARKNPHTCCRLI